MSTQYQSKEHSAEHSKQQYSEQSKQQFSEQSGQQFSGQSKQQFSEHSKEFSKANLEKTDVTVEKVVNPPIIQEHHHHHTHTIVHPEIVREHNTTEIRQVIQPVYEHVKGGEKEEYAGKEVRFVDKREDTSEALKKREAIQRDLQAKANVTHTEDKTSTVDNTKVTDVHSKHKVVEEVTPVIIRDVEHSKTIHKDEKQVERIYHAPEVHKEELEVQHTEGLNMDTHGIKEGYTAKSSTGIKEGYTAKSSTGIKEGYAAKSSTGIKEGHTKDTHGLKLFNKEGQMNKGTTGLKEEHISKGTTGLKEEHTSKGTTGLKADRIKKGVE